MGELAMMVLKDLWLAWERRRERLRDLAERQDQAWRRIAGESGDAGGERGR